MCDPNSQPIQRVGRSFPPGLLCPLGLTLLLAFLLRVNDLGTPSIGVDEGVSYYFSQQSLPDLWRLTITDDLHPPLYSLLLHCWAFGGGTSEFALRFSSLSFGLMLIPFLFKLGQTLFNSRVGLMAALLGSLSPIMVAYSQELRMYMPATFWGLLAAYGLTQAFKNRSNRWWLTYVLGAVAALYTHYATALVLVAINGFFALRLRHRSSPRVAWAVSQALVIVSFLPWLPHALAQLQRISDFWPGRLGPTMVLREVVSAFSFGVPLDEPGRVMGALGLGLLLALGLFSPPWSRQKTGNLLFLMVYVCLPILITYLVVVERPKFAVRYLLPATPPLYLLLATGWDTLRRWPWLAAGGLLALSLTLMAMTNSSAWFLRPLQADYRGAMGYALTQAQGGDALVLLINAYQPVEYYNRGRLPRYGLSATDGEAQLQAIRLKHPRLWLVLLNDRFVDPRGQLLYRLWRSAAELPIAATFTGLRLRLYDLSQTPPSPQPQSFSGFIALEGHQVRLNQRLQTPQDNAIHARRGELLSVDLYWRALTRPERDYTVFVHLLNSKGQVVAQHDGQPALGLAPTGAWNPGDTLADIYLFTIPRDASPGRYRLELGVYDAITGRRLKAQGGDDRMLLEWIDVS